MDKKIQEPLTLPVHSGLLHQVNEMIIALKVHFVSNEGDPKEKMEEAKNCIPKPDMNEVVELLSKCRNVIQEIRHKPLVKY